MVAGDSLILISCFIAGADLVGIDGDEVRDTGVMRVES
jgi:hypothetical protein